MCQNRSNQCQASAKQRVEEGEFGTNTSDIREATFSRRHRVRQNGYSSCGKKGRNKPRHGRTFWKLCQEKHPRRDRKSTHPIVVGEADDVTLREAGEVPHRRLQHRTRVADVQEVDRLRLELDEGALRDITKTTQDTRRHSSYIVEVWQLSLFISGKHPRCATRQLCRGAYDSRVPV